ncbi:MAG: hypothetical protein R3C55_02955 [Parvularculaceae bacterium]
MTTPPPARPGEKERAAPDNPMRLLDLLDSAYAAPNEPERFDELMEAAKRYFFKTGGEELAADIPHAVEFDGPSPRISTAFSPCSTRPPLRLREDPHRPMGGSRSPRAGASSKETKRRADIFPRAFLAI